MRHVRALLGICTIVLVASCTYNPAPEGGVVTGREVCESNCQSVKGQDTPDSPGNRPLFLLRVTSKDGYVDGYEYVSEQVYNDCVTGEPWPECKDSE